MLNGDARVVATQLVKEDEFPGTLDVGRTLGVVVCGAQNHWPHALHQTQQITALHRLLAEALCARGQSATSRARALAASTRTDRVGARRVDRLVESLGDELGGGGDERADGANHENAHEEGEARGILGFAQEDIGRNQHGQHPVLRGAGAAPHWQRHRRGRAQRRGEGARQTANLRGQRG